MPVVTDNQTASISLSWAIQEMNNRFELFREAGVRNLEQYNTQGSSLPFIVIVLDEFADLVLSQSGREIESSVSKLAAKARATGIHLILATQRPTTDVLTGVIKASFPTRIAFRVFSSLDSRVILDSPGAENLLGKGDMLFKQGIELLRFHAAYIDEDDIETLVNSLDEPQDADEQYNNAVRIVSEHRVASASFLQRKLGIGYHRASKLIAEMERKGIVGPALGSKPRNVLIPRP